MNCPVCPTVQLMMTDRQGIEIDFCPHCRGVWLDRGELDKIIERTQDVTPGARPQGIQPSTAPAYRGDVRDDARDNVRDDARSRERHGDDRHGDDRHGDDRYDGDNKKKKRGFLSEIFDFD